MAVSDEPARHLAESAAASTTATRRQCRRRAVPRPFRDGRAAVLARGRHRPGPVRRDAAAARRADPAGRPGRRPQRAPRGGRRLDRTGLPVEPARRRHRDRDQPGAGREGPRRGHRRRGRRAERQQSTCRWASGTSPALQTAPHHPADLGRHLGGGAAQLHRAGGGRDGPPDEDRPREHRGPSCSCCTARPAPARPPRCAPWPGPGGTGARWTASSTPSASSPTWAIHGHRHRRGRRLHRHRPLAAAAPGGLRRTDARRGRRPPGRPCPGC
ncbi:hypothetical protein SFUMM280S_07636 [Streptomyces fumanus]